MLKFLYCRGLFIKSYNSKQKPCILQSHMSCHSLFSQLLKPYIFGTPFIKGIDAAFKAKTPISYTTIEYVGLSWTKSEMLVLKQKRVYGLFSFFEKSLTNTLLSVGEFKTP